MATTKEATEAQRKTNAIGSAITMRAATGQYSAEILKVKEVNPEVTFVVGSAKEAVIVFRQARER